MNYSKESFTDLIKKSYDFKQEAYDTNPKWDILRRLYEDNFINATNKGDIVIPKKIHQIWLGSKIPDKYKKYADTWSLLNPEWEYKLWGDDDIKDIHIPQKKVFNTIKNQGFRSDFLRYNILNQFGGLYIDTDFECLKPFDNLSHLGFYTGIGYPHKVELYVGLIACTPHHPIVEHIIDSMTVVNEEHWLDFFDTAGPYFFTRCFFDVIDSYCEKVVALPTDYFYPFPNEEGHASRNGRDYIKECSYAVHHWAVSWLKK